MMSANDATLRVDGRSMSDIKQRGTTEIFGGGESMGPLTKQMLSDPGDFKYKNQGDFTYPVTWLTLHDAMLDLEKRGVSPNFASFIGAASLWEYAIGFANTPATPKQLQTMRELVDREMDAGALGIASALIYVPGVFATTNELIRDRQGGGAAPRHLHFALA